MQNLNSKLGKKGQGLVEYIVLVCLIAVAVFATIQTVGTRVDSKFQKADRTISQL